METQEQKTAFLQHDEKAHQPGGTVVWTLIIIALIAVGFGTAFYLLHLNNNLSNEIDASVMQDQAGLTPKRIRSIGQAMSALKEQVKEAITHEAKPEQETPYQYLGQRDVYTQFENWSAYKKITDKDSLRNSVWMFDYPCVHKNEKGLCEEYDMPTDMAKPDLTVLGTLIDGGVSSLKLSDGTVLYSTQNPGGKSLAEVQAWNLGGGALGAVTLLHVYPDRILWVMPCSGGGVALGPDEGGYDKQQTCFAEDAVLYDFYGMHDRAQQLAGYVGSATTN